ncbi:hypothetical protein F4Y93_12910 [Candidatus Poribacteria bacterium]|nr:hypothetical protein [Candidatus Poribacteria bacterium]
MRAGPTKQIAFVCALAVGFLPFTPLVKNAGAHSYTVAVYDVYRDICEFGTVHGSQSYFRCYRTENHIGEQEPDEHQHTGATRIEYYHNAYGGCPSPSYCNSGGCNSNNDRGGDSSRFIVSISSFSSGSHTTTE